MADYNEVFVGIRERGRGDLWRRKEEKEDISGLRDL